MNDNEFNAIKEGFKHVLDRIEDLESKVNVFKDKLKPPDPPIVEPAPPAPGAPPLDPAFPGRPAGMTMTDVNVGDHTSVIKNDADEKKPDRSTEIKSFWDKKIF